MILGRNAGLWAGLVQSGLNLAAAIIVAVTNTPMSAADVAAFAAANAFGLVVVALIANSSDPSTVPTFALTTRAPDPASDTATASQPSAGTAPTVVPSSSPSEAGTAGSGPTPTADAAGGGPSE